MNSKGTLVGGLVAVTLGVCATGCATTGTAEGELKEPTGSAAPNLNDAPVTLAWHADIDSTHGSISGNLPTGARYQGKYHEVVQTADADDYDDLWQGWRREWPDWDVSWHEGDGLSFVTIYTGRVVANLQEAKGDQRMRCRFRLDDPGEGMAGGGTGECQLTTGEVIDHVVLSQR